MQWYNAAGGRISLGHQSSRDRSDVLDVVTTKDDAEKDYQRNQILTNRIRILKRKVLQMIKKRTNICFWIKILKAHI